MSTLAEVFAKDPEHLTDQDLAIVIKGFRDARANFKAGKKSAGAAKNTGATKKLTLDEILAS